MIHVLGIASPLYRAVQEPVYVSHPLISLLLVASICVEIYFQSSFLFLGITFIVVICEHFFYITIGRDTLLPYYVTDSATFLLYCKRFIRTIALTQPFGYLLLRVSLTVPFTHFLSSFTVVCVVVCCVEGTSRRYCTFCLEDWLRILERFQYMHGQVRRHPSLSPSLLPSPTPTLFFTSS